MKPHNLDHPCKNNCSGWQQGFESCAELVEVSLIEIINRMSMLLKELCDCNSGEQCTQCFLVDESDEALDNYKKLKGENK